MASRRGFAMLAVLWVTALVAGLGVLLLSRAKGTVAASRNRISLAQAGWLAEGCAESVRATVREAMVQANAWRVLDSVARRAPAFAGCRVSVRAAGSSLDVNAVDGAQLRLTLVAAGVTPWAADSFTDALLDWRDGDSVPRRAGAERDWYRAHGLPLPRDGPFVSREDVLRVRGADRLGQAAGLLDVEPGRVAVDHVSQAVLAALPGMTDELVALAMERRGWHSRDGTFLDLAARVSKWARDSLTARYADLTRVATLDPDAWIVVSTAAAGDPVIESTVELRLERTGTEAAVTRRRTWP